MIRTSVIALTAVSLFLCDAAPASAQGAANAADTSAAVRQAAAARQAAGGPRPVPAGVLGGVPMTPADSAIKSLIGRLDFNNYKGLVKGLTQFGDRLGNTERNARAVDWIEAQLRSWGYQTERIKYEFTSRGETEKWKSEEVYATKVGSTTPSEMYIIGAHMDGRGGGEAANDDGSGTALVMEIARVLAAPDVLSNRSVRLALWNNEETGLNGARAYVEQRRGLQGIENPAGTGRYPEPKWLGMIQHDMMMWDHGNPVQHQQAWDADVDIEFQLNSVKAAESAQLALVFLNANRTFATDYPAVVSNSMSNTDSAPFQDFAPAISLRENRRLYETGRGANPHWHQPTDLYVNFSDADFRLGFNAAQTTLAAIARLAEIRIVKAGT